MFMHGPVAHFACVVGDISFRYVILIDSPGIARMTGGCSLPSNANATRPLTRSLTASKVTGECVSGGSTTIWARTVSPNSKVDARMVNLSAKRVSMRLVLHLHCHVPITPHLVNSREVNSRESQSVEADDMAASP